MRIGGLLLLCGICALAVGSELALRPKCAAEGCGQARSVHWVIRTGDLSRALEFYKGVLGMKVIRHEENPEACPITCNGESKAAWSKTMVGYGTEDKSYALEITFNYGVEAYQIGTGLEAIGVYVDDVAAASARAQQLGYHATPGGYVTGPDNYRIHLLPLPTGRQERFAQIELGVSSVAATLGFMQQKLGMTGQFHGDFGLLFYGDLQEAVPLRLRDTGLLRMNDWVGRHAIAMPEGMLREVYSALDASSVVHELRELKEALGVLVIAVVKDSDEFEICLVSSETFDRAVLAAADWKEPDWELRKRLARSTGTGDWLDQLKASKPS